MNPRIQLGPEDLPPAPPPVGYLGGFSWHFTGRSGGGYRRGVWGGAAKVHYDKGMDLYDRGLYEQAIEQYAKAIQLDPDYANAYVNRGISYKNLGQDVKAEADKAKACSVDSQWC